MGQVLLFGRLKDAFGAASVGFPSGATTAADVRAMLAAAHPEQAELIRSRAVRMAVNQVLVADESMAVSNHDEIALLPPLSGG